MTFYNVLLLSWKGYHMKYIKPYLIYNNNQLKDLILKMPKNKDELKLVAGFGEIKVNKYGDDILKIVNKHR